MSNQGRSLVRTLAVNSRCPQLVFTKAFTLVELLVVMVILSILSSLSLAGLNIGRQRAKKDKTISTIRKLDEIVQGMFADRLATGGSAEKKARLLTYEMPDQWSDVQIVLAADARSATMMRYARIGSNPETGMDFRPTLNAKLGPAECLWLIVARSGYEPDALEQFRPDELSDRDGDGANEFCDGWGQPIYFLRCAPGFTPYSAIQTPSEVDAARLSNDILLQLNSLTPLIYSAGADGANVDVLTTEAAYGLQRPPSPRVSFAPFSDPNSGMPESGSTAYRDNITNHDIMAR